MADKKISALTGASTPLAGTEVLPIVQSGSTVKATVANIVGAGTSPGSFTNITGSANAIISVTDNTNAALRITQLGTGNALLVEDTTNPDSTPFVIDASGNIASGLTSTTLAMEIYRTTTANFRIDGDGVNTTIQARTFSDVSADSGPVLNYVRARGTKAASTIVQSGDLLAQFRGSGWDGVQIIQAANIEVRVDGTPGTSDMPGRLVFGTTADGASSPTERMRISSTGIVTMSAYGVGTATFSAAGVISSVSDETYKIKDGVIADPIPMVMALETGYYYGKPEANMGDGRQLGFYAQNVRAAIGPEAAPDPETYTVTDEDGVETIKTKPWGYYDRSVLAVAIEAIKVQQAQITALTARIATLEAKCP